MKVSENFILQEFVPQKIYELFKEDSRHFVSDFMINTAQLIRDLSGCHVTLNNWSFGGGRNYSGYRPPFSTIGAKRSAHKFSMAIDPKVDGMSVSEVHKMIMENHPVFWALGVRRLESKIFTPTWTHLDSVQTVYDKIITFKP